MQSTTETMQRRNVRDKYKDARLMDQQQHAGIHRTTKRRPPSTTRRQQQRRRAYFTKAAKQTPWWQTTTTSGSSSDDGTTINDYFLPRTDNHQTYPSFLPRIDGGNPNPPPATPVVTPNPPPPSTPVVTPNPPPATPVVAPNPPPPSTPVVTQPALPQPTPTQPPVVLTTRPPVVSTPPPVTQPPTSPKEVNVPPPPPTTLPVIVPPPPTTTPPVTVPPPPPSHRPTTAPVLPTPATIPPTTTQPPVPDNTDTAVPTSPPPVLTVPDPTSTPTVASPTAMPSTSAQPTSNGTMMITQAPTAFFNGTNNNVTAAPTMLLGNATEAPTAGNNFTESQEQRPTEIRVEASDFFLRYMLDGGAPTLDDDDYFVQASVTTLEYLDNFMAQAFERQITFAYNDAVVLGTSDVPVIIAYSYDFYMTGATNDFRPAPAHIDALLQTALSAPAHQALLTQLGTTLDSRNPFRNTENVIYSVNLTGLVDPPGQGPSSSSRKESSEIPAGVIVMLVLGILLGSTGLGMIVFRRRRFRRQRVGMVVNNEAEKGQGDPEEQDHMRSWSSEGSTNPALWPADSSWIDTDWSLPGYGTNNSVSERLHANDNDDD